MRSGREIIEHIGSDVSVGGDSFSLEGDLGANYADMFYYLTRNKLYSIYQETGDEKCFDKGLLLYGDVGVGKSFFFKFLRYWYYHNEGLIYDRLINVPFRDIEKMYRSEGVRVWSEYGSALEKELIVDEVIKDDNVTQKHYGNLENTFEELILERYKSFIDKGIKTHFTTNATPEKLKVLFHSRVSDRLREMCNVHLWVGKSLRK